MPDDLKLYRRNGQRILKRWQRAIKKPRGFDPAALRRKQKSSQPNIELAELRRQFDLEAPDAPPVIVKPKKKRVPREKPRTPVIEICILKNGCWRCDHRLAPCRVSCNLQAYLESCPF